MNAPGVGIENFELRTVRKTDDFAPDRHPAGNREDQSTEGVDILVILVREGSADALLESFQFDTRIGDP